MKQILLLLILLSNTSFSQSLENILANLAAGAANSYAKPVASTFGSNLNSAWVEKVPTAKSSKFFVKVSIYAMGSFFNDEDRNFELFADHRLKTSVIDEILLNSGIRVSHEKYEKLRVILSAAPQKMFLSGPTIIGSNNEALKVKYPGDVIEGVELKPYQYTVPEVTGYLSSLTLLPSAAFQVTIGSICGTNLSIRYFPDYEINDLGRLSYWGTGFVHNPESWLAEIKYFDYGFGFFHQKMTVGDLFESTATQFGIYMSETYGEKFLVTPLISFRYEMAKTIISYTYKYFDQLYGIPISINRPIEIDMRGKNRWTLGIGLSMEYSLFNLTLGYKFAATPTIRGGISFKI